MVKICSLLRPELHEWLAAMQLEEYFTNFLKEDLLLNTIASIEDSMIDQMLDKLTIEAVGVRLKIKNSIAKLKGT